MTEPRKGWNLDRSISVGDLLVFLSLALAGLGYVMHQDNRATKTEEGVSYLKATDARHDSVIKELKTNIDQKLDRLEAKVDRLVERR